MTHQVDESRFVSATDLASWQQRLDDRGLRATGSLEHEEYVSDLAVRLRAGGVSGVQTESFPMRRWIPRNWSLECEGASIRVISPISYSGATEPEGVTAEISIEPRPGTIGLAFVGLTTLTAGMFDLLDWDAPARPHHDEGYDPSEPYARVWLSQEAMRAELARHKEAGAVGLIIVVDLPAEELPAAYLLYDGVHRELPSLFVGREEGARLRTAASKSYSATLTLVADVEEVETSNVVGLIPGSSDELVILHSHTDGPNGLEDNGPEAIVAMAGYLATLPPEELARGILILLSTGHFALEEAWGVPVFLQQHSGDYVPRVAAAVTLEHLGARVSPPGRSDNGDHQYEFGCVFSTGHRPLIDAMRAALDEANVTESRVLRPFAPDLHHRSPDGTTWPGDGCAFWEFAGLAAANFITGPGYLLNVEPVAQLIDAEAMRRQAIAFTNSLLELTETPWSLLHTAAQANAPAVLG